jgi:hypothetical protein
MEFFIRGAMEKYFVSGQLDNELAAVKKFNDVFIEPACKSISQTVWRHDNTFNVYADNYVRAYEPLWKYLYKNNTGKHKKPG